MGRTLAGTRMGSATALAGRCILVVEDEALIALDVIGYFEEIGCRVLRARSLAEGLRLAEHPQICAAILDFRLGENDSAAICARLKERGIPFVVYTGYSEVDDACRGGTVITKPATSAALIDGVAALLR